MQSLQETARRLWGQLSLVQRISMLGLTVAVIGAMALLLMWASTPTYGVLFTNLSSADAGAIVNQLQAGKTPYQLADGGTTILVPQQVVDNERLQLATQGLPQGGVVGFSLFDKQSIFQGDSFTEQINYTRALEGELTQTIDQLAGVQYTRVNIVLPQQSLFSSDQSNPTASVLVKMNPGATLSADQVTGIEHLVASAVQGLKPDAVTVVDGSGNILSDSTSPSASATGLTALQTEDRYASQLEAQIGAMLDTVLGPDHAVVRVNDVMDFTQKSYTATDYGTQSATSPITSSHIVDNQTINPDSIVGGTVGLGSNVPTYGTKAGATVPVTNTQHLQDITYSPSMTTTTVVNTPGVVQQLSVAVVLDQVQSPAELASIRQAVSAAVGLNPARGDRLSITAVPFDTSAAAASARAQATQQQTALILSIVRWSALLIVPLVLLFLLLRILAPARRKTTDVEGYSRVRVVEESDLELTAAQPLASLPPGPEIVARQTVAEIAREKPEILAGVIARWIDEDRR